MKRKYILKFRSNENYNLIKKFYYFGVLSFVATWLLFMFFLIIGIQAFESTSLLATIINLYFTIIVGIFYGLTVGGILSVGAGITLKKLRFSMKSFPIILTTLWIIVFSFIVITLQIQSTAQFTSSNAFFLLTCIISSAISSWFLSQKFLKFKE